MTRKFSKNGLKEGVENKDIKKINITYTPSYGYNLTYYYINSEDGRSKWVENPEKYINYITNNGGYNGPEMYRKFSDITWYGVKFLLIMPLAFLILYVLRSIKCKIQKGRTV